MTVGVDAWNEALDQFEAAIEACIELAVAVEERGTDLPPLPPALSLDDLGPVPGSLTLRLQELTTRSQLVEAELVRVRDGVGAELAAMHRVTHVYDHSPPASRLDEQA